MKIFERIVIAMLCLIVGIGIGRRTYSPKVITKEVMRDVRFFDMNICDDYYRPYIEELQKKIELMLEETYKLRKGY
jgi:hypothetical protein